MTASCAAAVLLIAASAPADNGLDAALSRMPADTVAAVVVPNLDAADEELETWLEGMDRAGLLLGADPIEQVLAWAGIPLHVDNNGALVIAQRAGGEIVSIIPVADHAAFLQGNFEQGGSGQWSLDSGPVFRARDLDGHVALEAILAGEDGEAVEPYALLRADRIPAWWAAHAPHGPSMLRMGEVVIVGDAKPLTDALLSPIRPAVLRLESDLLPASALGAIATTIERLLAPLFGDRGSAIVIDFDPLALVIRSHAASGIAPRPTGIRADERPRSRGLDRLPAKPYLVAGAVDGAALGDPDALDFATAVLGPIAPPASIADSSAVQWAVYRSPAGLRGGVLNDTVVLLETDDAAGARGLARVWMTQRAEHDGVDRSAVTWRDGVEIEDAGVVSTYEVRPAAGLGPMAIIMNKLTFGAMGWRGLVADVDGGVLLQCGRRPSTLRAVRTSAAGNDDAPLGRDHVIAALRNWMPRERDVEMYADASALLRLGEEAIATYPLLGSLPFPESDAELPPIGVGVDFADGSVETAVILPAGVTAILIDWGLRIAPLVTEEVAP